MAASTLCDTGAPALSRRGWVSRDGYTDWWAEYGRVGLAPDETPPPLLKALASKVVQFVASPIPRAKATAELLAEGREIHVDEVYEEAPLPAPLVIPFLRLPPPIWGFASRISWWLGYSAGGETRYQAEIRAREAADRLIELAANKNGDVLLCGHGWFNFMAAKELRKRGWTTVESSGVSGYWTLRSFASPL